MMRWAAAELKGKEELYVCILLHHPVVCIYIMLAFYTHIQNSNKTKNSLFKCYIARLHDVNGTLLSPEKNRMIQSKDAMQNIIIRGNHSLTLLLLFFFYIPFPCFFHLTMTRLTDWLLHCTHFFSSTHFIPHLRYIDIAFH